MSFQTIQDLINYTYALGGQPYIAKADAPVLSTTTGVFNAVFGAVAFNQLNSEANAFALLPKYPWQKSGFRVISADAGSTASGNTAENGAVPESIKPTFQEITVTPAQVAHTFEVSYIHDLRADLGDDAIASMDFLRGYFSTLHAKRINEQLLADVDTVLPSGAFESIDRITASSAAATASLFTAGDEDIYGVDRSANTWFDAVVSHASTVDRTLQVSIIEDHLAVLENNGAKTNLLLTGTDTKWRIISLMNSQVRYQGSLKQNELARVGINGVETEEGLNWGVRVTMVFNIPMFASQAVPKDTISRIYALDTTVTEVGLPKLGIAMLAPTMYFESGMSAAMPNPFAIGTFGTKGVFYTAGQTVCLIPKHQGSIRDLK